MTTEPSTRHNSTQGNSPAILVVVLVAFALVLGGFGTYRYTQGRDSASWPTVSGTITYSHAESSRRSGKMEYRAAVKYRYTVGGKAYTGRRINASDEYQKNLGSANDILRHYPVGATVTVSYDPEEPGSSLLEAGVPGNTYVMIAAAILCLLGALAIGVSALRRRGQPA